MDLRHFLEEKKSSVLSRWFDLVLESYPPNSRMFLKEQENRFANPVGSTIFRGMETLYAVLLRDGSTDEARPCLEAIVRIRAVQDFPPSQAVSFIPVLKQALRDKLGKEIREPAWQEEMGGLERRIDQWTLQAFDLYMGCREQIHNLRMEELRRRSEGIGERRMKQFYRKR